jgi:ribosome-associated toxin RatA of RatAB toxin-antitoxin module
MTVIKKSALLPYTPAQMYALVDDIDSYPKFLPWCGRARTLSRNEDEVHAEITVAHGAFNKAFSTLNRLQRDKMIEMRLVEGPFKRLEGLWRFDPVGDDGCKIALDLEFAFSNKLVEFAIGSAFSHIANTLVDAFCQRARQVYG